MRLPFITASHAVATVCGKTVVVLRAIMMAKDKTATLTSAITTA